MRYVNAELEPVEVFLGLYETQNTTGAAIAADRYENVASLESLCATRWTVRGKALRNVLDQYEVILEALEEMAAGKSNAATRAAGLLATLQKGNTFLALLMAIDVIEPLELLNTTLHARSNTVSGIIKAAHLVKNTLAKKRTNEEFSLLLKKAESRQ